MNLADQNICMLKLAKLLHHLPTLLDRQLTLSRFLASGRHLFAFIEYALVIHMLETDQHSSALMYGTF